VSAVDSTVVDPVGPVVVCLGLIPSSTPQRVTARPLESLSTRAPPHPSS